MNISIIPWLALLFLYTTASLVPAQRSPNLQLPHRSVPVNATVFPRDPPGFGVHVYLHIVRPLNTEKVYLAAIAVIHDWAFEGWNAFIPSRSTRFTKTTYGITISWRSIAYARERDQLQMKHLILGMLHLIERMTEQHIFCVSTSSVQLYMQGVGHIELLPSETLARNNVSDEGLAALHNTSLRAPRAQNLTSKRKIVDPTDSDFAILYERNGEVISFVDFLSAVLYAMATAAQASNDQHCRDLAGFNIKRNVVYRINGGRTTELGPPLTYGSVRRGLQLLSAALYDEDIAGEVRFQFLYQGDVLGVGNIALSDFASSTAR
ncbi:MAG: hypothetical protein HETSPECPRED_002385 [Heterodermia speciosa]|uniref:Uncharacterized protein n=1 Tax=Heterodermia speciosa TaxID=116794 RepID=A0A8H3PGI6_9LECA|nr:MAG: hypothetical protein HETSPECPRED_002385 [Heterodermia speciosa]